MSSRFVSGGAIDAETGEAVAPASVPAPQESASQPEKSLFEVLQANKEAKQAAFEEANKFKHQFRALDDDEIDFLDGVKASQR
ncbi:hypothetical protein GQ53DRAFT_693728, partial [Thozetella sp. PMI_491]